MNDLGYVRSAHWVPHLLTDEQKQRRVRLASQVIEKYDKCDPHRFEEIVTGDETWIYNFQSDSNAKNKVWVSSEGDRRLAKHQIACCMRYSLIRKVQSFIFQSLKVVQSVTGKFYRESVLTQLVDFYQKCRQRTGVRGIKLLHDNAPAHKSATVQEWARCLRSSPIQP